MPNTAELLKQATYDARKAWMDFSEQKLKEIYIIFKKSSDNIIEKINRYAVAGKIPPHRLNILYQEIQKEMAYTRQLINYRFKALLKSGVDFGIENSMLSLYDLQSTGLISRFKVGLGNSLMGLDGKIRKYDPKFDTYESSMWGRINNSAMEFLYRFQPEGITFSKMIWKITAEAERAIRRAVAMATLEGWSSGELSRSIRGFLNEPNMLFRRVRKDGQLVLSRAARGYHPGQGVYRSSYKNAMRLARTELARAYSEGTLRYGQTKPWIDGSIWRIGSGNPCPHCEDLAGTFFPKGSEEGIPLHPNCMCYWELHVNEKLLFR